MTERTTSGLHEFLFERFLEDKSRSLRVLDIGCGTGAWLNRLEAAGFDCSKFQGVDFDDDFAGDPRIYTKVDLNHPDWFDLLAGEFDLITSIEVIEHIPNQYNFMFNISKLMSSGGKVIITTPNISSLNARIRFLLKSKMPQFDELADPTHFMPIYPEALGRMIAQFGLQITKLSTYPERQAGSGMYSFPVRAAAKVGSLFLEDRLPGDIVVFEIEKL